MKITIEATNPAKYGEDVDTTFAKVTIELPQDELRLDEVIENLVKPALKGYGYLPETVDEIYTKPD